VLPGDQAAGRVPDPLVRTELVYQRVQQAKRRASGHLSAGDAQAAIADIKQAQAYLREAPPDGPLAADIAEEARTLEYLAQQTEQGMIARAAKYSSMDAHYKSSMRGRSRPPETTATSPDPDDTA
jgi:Ca-activated chloride channel family protein